MEVQKKFKKALTTNWEDKIAILPNVCYCILSYYAQLNKNIKPSNKGKTKYHDKTRGYQHKSGKVSHITSAF